MALTTLSRSDALLLHRPAGTGEMYWGPGDMYRFLVTGEQTGGAYFAMEAFVPPGGGPPPHFHRNEDETFYVLEGLIEFLLGDETITGAAGDFVNVPKGTLHCFRNISLEPVRMILTFTPAGIEKFFEEAFHPAVEGKEPPPVTPELIARLMAASARHGQTVLPPPQS